MYKNNFSQPNIISPTRNKVNKLSGKLLDRIGLEQAYKTDKGIYQHGKNLYIAGTKSFGDVIDDLKLPFDKGAKNAQRYTDVKEYLKDHPEVENVIGHSLGGATSLQLNKDSPNKYHILTYGSPAIN